MRLSLSVSMTTCPAAFSGPLSAGPDIAPQFAGVIWGIAGSLGNLTGVLAPTVAAAMTTQRT